MKKYKTVKETRQTSKFVEQTCDICGYVCKYQDWDNDPNQNTNEFSSSYFDTDVEIKYRYGINYPEGGHGFEYNLDVCPKCFIEKIVPLLKTNKEPNKWDW